MREIYDKEKNKIILKFKEWEKDVLLYIGVSEVRKINLLFWGWELVMGNAA